MIVHPQGFIVRLNGPMKILISKNGQQLGPYTIEAARALVLAGTVIAKDWAWIDGATDWVPLNTIPDFSNYQPGVQKIPSAAPKAVPSAPGSPVTFVSAAQETELWKGSPSQWLNLKVHVIWVLIFVGLFVLSKILKANATSLTELPPIPFGLVAGVLALICLVQCSWLAIKLLATHYTVTNQRVRVVRGILSKDVQEIELFRLKDTSAHQTLFLRLFGLGNVKLVSGDVSNPVLLLLAIPKAIQLRERLRQEVFALRQRFGVRELDIMQGN